MRHRKKGDEMLVAAVRWKMEGRGDSWCLCARKRKEMKRLLLLWAGRWREEEGIHGAYALEKERR
jgi:hypothetical protein